MTYHNDHLERSLTKYMGKDEKVVAELKSDFTRSDFLPDTQFIDYRDHYEYGVKFNLSEKNIELSTKETAKANWKKTFIKSKDSMMLFQGALNFIGKNIKKLRAHEDLEAELVLPSRHDSIGVIIELVTEGPTDDKLKVRIKAKSALLRMVVPETLVVLDSKTGRVLQFEGNHSLLDEKDKSQFVIIKYVYE